MLRVLGYLFLLALAAALLFSACVSACGVAVVSVAAEGETFTAPVPLLLPLAALRFAPERLFDGRSFGGGRREFFREHFEERDSSGWRSRREWRYGWRYGWRQSGFAGLPPEAVLGLRAVSGLLDALEGVENAQLVDARDGESRVSVAVEDGELVVLARGGGRRGPRNERGSGEREGDTVEARVPLEALREAADACREDESDDEADGEIVECDLRRLVSSFLRSARGSKIRVQAEDASVGITVW